MAKSEKRSQRLIKINGFENLFLFKKSTKVPSITIAPLITSGAFLSRNDFCTSLGLQLER